MTSEKINLVGRFHHHIDNGGIDIQVNVEVEKEDGENKSTIITPEIVFSTNYFGYARLESKLIGQELSPYVLKQMGRFFFDASAELEKLQKLHNC